MIGLSVGRSESALGSTTMCSSSKEFVFLYIINSSFAPKENHLQMTKFQIGSGKSDSFFFYTANSQFIIKTLKETELKLLVKKGVLEKYF
jgi:Phosphatidylinositol-4-phosphate 5-Kinase